MDVSLVRYNEIAKDANSFLQDYFGPKSELLKGYNFLRQYYSSHKPKSVDYEIYGVSFSYAFFLENFWKTILVFLENPPGIRRNVLDIGAGSGASSLAYLAWLDTHIAPNLWHINVTFLDRSKKQLEFLQLFLRRFKFQHLDLNVNFIHQDFNDWEHDEDGFDLVLFGHMLNENIGHLSRILRKAEYVTSPNGKMYILERCDDELTWEKLNESASQLVLSNIRSRVTVDAANIFRGNSPHLYKKKSIATCYSSIQIAPDKNFHYVLQKYFEAWEKKSPELLDQVFSKEAEYEEKPFEVTYKGLREIKSYWREKVVPQDEIVISILRVHYVGNTALVKWHAGFQLGKEKFKEIKGIIEFTYDTSCRRIVRLEEYFRTHSSIALSTKLDEEVKPFHEVNGHSK